MTRVEQEIVRRAAARIQPCADPEQLSRGIAHHDDDPCELSDIELALVVAHEATARQYAVLVGSRYLCRDRVFRAKPEPLSAAEALAIIDDMGVERVLLFRAEDVVDRSATKLDLRTRCAISMVDLVEQADADTSPPAPPTGAAS